MRKTIALMFGMALFAGAGQSSAQEVKAKPGYIGIRYDAHYEIFLPEQRSNGKVIVKDVSKDSPAEKAGVKAGDEIIRINGMSAANGKFSAVARTLTEGDTVNLRVKRGTQEREYTLIAAARPTGTYAGMLGNGTYVFSADSIRGLAKLWMDSAMVHLDSINFPRIYV
jgi:C-terminal processing protease CtpA/Prc